MGTTRIKVIDLSQATEQIKTSRKRAVKGLMSDIKSPLVEKKKAKVQPKIEEEKPESAEIQENVISQGKPQEEPKVIKKKSKFTRTHGKKYQSAKLLVDPQQFYPIDEAIKLAKKTSFSKFDGSLEVHTTLKNNKPVRGTITLPHGQAKTRKILVFTKHQEGISKNGILIGDEKTIDKIAQGELKPVKDFDLIISEPEFMPKLATLGKILGPKGLMPNPKTGTVSDNPKEALEKFAQGHLEYKNQENAPVVHLSVGKLSLEEKHLKENILAFLTSIGSSRIKKLVLSPSMGPGIKVDLSSLSKN